MITIKDIKIPGYKKVIEAEDPDANLHCFIAIHDSTLGPALGGIRIYPYVTTDEALNDVLRLAQGMTYKSAIAELGLGGGKSVIIANPKKDRTEKLLLAFGKAVNHLNGEYIAAEDIGSSTEDMTIIRKQTPYVAALETDKSSGDPSRFTAWGIFRGIQAVAYRLWNNPSVRNRTIAIQGLGHVGSKLADLLFWEGANLIVCDTDTNKVKNHVHLYGAATVDSKNFCATPCDILAPCALGAIINDTTIPKLNCKAIAGAANNQLLKPEHGKLLKEEGILYAPDYIINAGGIINAAAEFEQGGYDPKRTRDKVDHIYEILLTVFDKSEKENKPTSQVADELAEYNIKHGIHKRSMPIKFE